MDETFEIIKAGPQNAPPEQALYRIQHTYSDGSGARLNVDWEGLLRLHEVIHDRIAMEGCVCETCSTRGCHHPATWEIECRGAGVSGRLIYSCDEHCPDPATTKYGSGWSGANDPLSEVWPAGGGGPG